jgi:hypothetical protein
MSLTLDTLDTLLIMRIRSLPNREAAEVTPA